MPIYIVRQDITKLEVDAIVNAANTQLQMGDGVCGAIFRAAGAVQLQAACAELAPIATGEAVVTPGFNLPAKLIIHAAGPIYQVQAEERSEQLLYAAYISALKQAIAYDCASVAFPLISSGIYGYPPDKALQVAMSAVQDFIAEHELEVTLAVLDKTAFSGSRELLEDVASYLEDHYLDEQRLRRLERLQAEQDAFLDIHASLRRSKALTLEEEATVSSAKNRYLDDVVDNLEESFSRLLLQLIDAKGMTDVEVYKRANLDRKLFSKIRTGKAYTPSKRTAIALAMALELSLGETDTLLERAGYALSRAVKFDVIVEYFIIHGRYDVFEINQVLFEYDQPLLGG